MKADLRTFWRLVRPHARPQLGTLVLVVLLGLVSSFGQGAVILFLGPLWNLVLFPESAGAPGGLGGAGVRLDPLFLSLRDLFLGADAAGLATTDEKSRIAVLLLVGGGVLAFAFVSSAAQYGFTYLGRQVSYHMVVDLRMRLARHLMTLSLRYHGGRRLGDLLSRVSADVQTTLHSVQIVLKEYVLQPANVVAYLVVAALMAPFATLGVLLAMPILVVPVSILARKVRSRSTKSLTQLGSSLQVLTQMFQGVRTVKAFRAEDRELERYRAVNRDYLKTSMRMVRAIATTHAWTVLYGLAGMAVLLLSIGWAHVRFGMWGDAASLAGFVLAISKVATHLKYLARATTKVEESVGASERLLAILEEEADVREAERPVRLARLDGPVRFERVSFRYPGSDERAIRELDIELSPGEVVALVGPSGAGKSTLADLLCRFVDPTEGRIVVDGHDLREIAVDDWTALYARVDQAPFLFHASIGENVAYGRPDATQAEIEEAARAANIHDFVAGLPEGYDTDVADMGTRLSGGQRQRITIARAILKGAPLLVLDEATSALDSESEAAVQEALDHLMEGRTSLVIAHRLSTVRHADRIAVLEAGRLVEVGTHDELVAAGGVYARLAARQLLEPTGAERAAAGSATRP